MMPKPAALAATALLHAAMAASLVWDRPHADPAQAPGQQSVRVRLLQTASPGAAPLPARAGPVAGSAGPHYYLPHELDRELIPLIDRSGDADIELARRVVMVLLVDRNGRVAGILFEDEQPDVLLQARLRLAFSTMEFLPAQKGGRPVAARMTIELLPNQQLAGE